MTGPDCDPLITDATAARLSTLQDDILESNELYMADEVIEAIQAALPDDVALFF